MSDTTSTTPAPRPTRRAPKATEPSTEATPAPEPKPTRSSAQPTKRQPKPKAAAMPECPRKHTAEAAKARCAAYYERNGHFKPTHMKAAKGDA